MQFPLAVELRRSPRLVALLSGMHLLAAGAVWVLPWPLPVRLLLLFAVAASAGWALRKSPVQGLHLAENGELTLSFADGGRRAATIEGESAVFNGLIVLRLREVDGQQRRTLVVLPDSLAADELRTLRLWLRWRADASEQRGADA